MMKENKYDDSVFFEKYNAMERSKHGLKGAGEWHILKEMLPNFLGKRVLDLGCGMGWHCIYAIQRGALSVTGVDISERMIDSARRKLPMLLGRMPKVYNTFRLHLKKLTWAHNSLIL